MCQELLPNSISAFIFFYDSAKHGKHANAEQVSQKKHFISWMSQSTK